jgi:signal transduction histidine kinase
MFWNKSKQIVFLLICCYAFGQLFSACSPRHKDEVNSLNESSYYYHYRDIDSTLFFAEKAYEQAVNYDAGKAEALNNMAFVSLVKMDYENAEQQLQKALDMTDNQIELLVADVQLMRLCQRQSRNKDFYGYRESAIRRIKRINEECSSLDEHQHLRLIYAESEFRIVESTYFYYVGLLQRSAQALNNIDPDGDIKKDVAQLLNYYYNIGAGGIINKGSADEIQQLEFDYLLRCFLLSRQYNLPYWEANSMQAIAEHMEDDHSRRKLIKDNLPAMKFLNTDNMPDSLLAGNLAQRSLAIFQRYGDVYQIAGSYRTLAKCFWGVEDYGSAIICLNNALRQDEVINKAPDLVASIREQLSLAYSAIDDKRSSDYNRNIYLDMQEQTRQDRQLEARATQLDHSSKILNWMIVAVVFMIVVVVVLLIIFDSMRRMSEKKQSIHTLLAPLNEWKQRNEEKMQSQIERREEVDEEIEMARRRLQLNKERNLEQRAKISLVNSITPLIDRIINELSRIKADSSNKAIVAERLQYISELIDKINADNEVLTKWIQLRQGQLRLHVESFPLQHLFDIVSKDNMAFKLHGIDFVVKHTKSVVKADPILTLFMINTLADNAKKFTPKGGKVIISANESDSYVEISVADTGIGMSEQQMGHVFDTKPILDSNSAQIQQSHGFGLMNCKGIIEKYRKTSQLFSVCNIAVEKNSPTGSRFFFRLPKGILRVLLALSILVTSCPLSARAKRNHNKYHNSILEKASQYADSAYYCNVRGQYERTFLFADSCCLKLNEYYANIKPYGHDYMQLPSIASNDTKVAEISWFKQRLSIDYDIILDIRNESAVAALAMHLWDVYNYNNQIYTQLFRLKSADNSLDNYVRVMERSENSKNVAIILLILLLISIFPAYYFLYYRHRLYYRFCLDRVMKINSVLLAEDNAEKKLDAISHIWMDRQVNLIPKESSLHIVVTNIKEALRKSIDTNQQLLSNIELAEDELNRIKYEDAKLYVSNNVLDNCLSTLKHETMYYPSRIKQLIDLGDFDIQTVTDVAQYYKEIYSLLSLQAQRQLDSSFVVDNNIIDYLFVLLKKLSQAQNIDINAKNVDNIYSDIEVVLYNYPLTDSQASLLFTSSSVNIDFMLCRQILREMGDNNNLRACGIMAYNKGDNTYINIRMPKITWQRYLTWKNNIDEL